MEIILLTIGFTSYGVYLPIRLNRVNTGPTFHRSVRKILGRQITSQTQKACDGLDWQNVIGSQIIVSFCDKLAFSIRRYWNISLFQETLTSQNIEWHQLWSPCMLSFPQPTTECWERKMFLDMTSYMSCIRFYYINTSEIPGEHSRVNMKSSQLKIACYFRKKKITSTVVT